MMMLFCLFFSFFVEMLTQKQTFDFTLFYETPFCLSVYWLQNQIKAFITA